MGQARADSVGRPRVPVDARGPARVGRREGIDAGRLVRQALSRSATALPGRFRALGGLGGHVVAPHFYERTGRATVARPVTTFSARWFSAHTSSSTRCTSSLDDLPTTRPRQVTTSFSLTSAANLTPSFLTVPAPDQSVTAWPTNPIDSIPWAKTPPMPAARANSSS